MAECMFTQKVQELGIADEWEIDSAATSTEEIGNPIYPPARRKLNQMGVKVLNHRARQITRRDMEYFDIIVYMDSNNLWNLRRMFRDDLDKLQPMLEEHDVADPWYTGDFTETYEDIEEGIGRILKNCR